MSLWEVLVVAVGLSMDALAVSLAASASQRAVGGRATFRLAFHFGLFQCLMPILGWLLGTTVAPYIAAFDHWIAMILLGIVGGRMIRSGLSDDEASSEAGEQPRDPSRGLTLIMLSVATSIDALAVGLTLAMLGSNIWQASVIIGLVTGGLSVGAVRIGSRVGQTFGKKMEVVGGLALVAIGLRILVQHLFA
jgi:manganese efflux pump family protein